MDPPSYSRQSLDRTREKYDKEIAQYEKKWILERRSHDETRKLLFEARHAANQLASSLGFEDVGEAQEYLDENNGTSYRRSMTTLQDLQAELRERDAIEDQLRKRVDKLQKQNVEPEEKCLGRSPNLLSAELEDLKVRYDALEAQHSRLQDIYMRDAVKWTKVKNWLCPDELVAKKKGQKLSEEEKKSLENKTKLKRRKEWREAFPDGIPAGTEKENANSERDELARYGISRPSPPPLPSSPPLVFQDVKNALPLRRHRNPQAAPLNTSRILAQNSSDAELEPEDIILVPSSPLFQVPNTARPVVVSLPNSLTEEESQVYAPPPPPPSQPRHPTAPQNKKKRVSDIGPSTEPLDGEPPHKQRRLSEGSQAKSSHGKTGSTASKSSTPARAVAPTYKILREELATPIAGPSRPRLTEKPLLPDFDDPFTAGSSSKRQTRLDFSTPPAGAPTSTSRKAAPTLVNYSAYKGRGRYGKAAGKNEKTINDEFMIDPRNNDGVDYQYDEVVRNKAERKKMHGGDCECCRDYYEAVGPLPPRLQAPLWKSPVRNTSNGSNSTPSSPTKRASEIAAHKQAISRHRHKWARATTPPGYWSIGFPDTQQVEKINEDARRLQERKREEIGKEAGREGGRYKRR